MTTGTYVYSTVLTVIDCGACRIPFAIPHDLYAACLADGRWFYCPNGDKIHYAETDNAKLKRQLDYARDRAAAEQARADGAEASLRTTKGHVTRLRKQVLAGECPLCGQHLRDLARHIARQHADVDPEADPTA